MPLQPVGLKIFLPSFDLWNAYGQSEAGCGMDVNGRQSSLKRD
jgi:hypothetical protein